MSGQGPPTFRPPEFRAEGAHDSSTDLIAPNPTLAPQNSASSAEAPPDLVQQAVNAAAIPQTAVPDALILHSSELTDPPNSLPHVVSAADHAPGDAAADDSDEQDFWRSGLDSCIDAAPAWLASAVTHLLLLIVLALCLLPLTSRPRFELEAVFAEKLGEQLLEDDVLLSLPAPLAADEQVLTPKDLPPVVDPLAAPPDLQLEMPALSGSSNLAIPEIGLALTGRERGMKEALLAAYGGTASTEAAVRRGLEWLKRQQRRKGYWSLIGPYKDGGNAENKMAATAMAMLAFQGAGHTHAAGDYEKEVRRGLEYILRDQGPAGSLTKGSTGTHRLYTHAQATIALCELFAMSQDSSLREPAQRAIDYAVRSQGTQGGWRYIPGEGSDTSVTGWFVMALFSARMAGLTVPDLTLERASRYLDTVATEYGSRYAYLPDRGESPTMTAEALLCRQYLGWSRDDERLIDGVRFVLDHPIEWRNKNVYYWYYATQVTHHMEGDFWDEWNLVMREEIPKRQVRDGRDAGSWSPEGDRWGIYGGRLFSTSLCIYMLEVYYRHLPIYAKVYGDG